MKRITTVTALLLAFCAGTIVLYGSAQSDKKEDIRAFMRVKLKHAQDVLEGLSLEDYDKIATASEKMSLLSLESNWRVISTAYYAEQSTDFRRVADRMTKAAKDKKLDSATLAYVEMTLRCVQCHKYVRSSK